MRLDDDELTKEDIAAFKEAECFYVVISPAPKHYEVVRLIHDEVEFDEYDEPSVLHEPDTEKFRHDAYWFDDEDEANKYVKILRELDKLSEETVSLLKQTDEFLTSVKSEENKGQQAGKEETFFEETESALGIGGAWGNVASIAVYDSERHSRYHRISVERFKELSDFTYDRYNPYLTTDGDNAQVIWITVFMKDGACYKRECVEENYQRNEKWVRQEIGGGRFVPDDLPIENGFVKRLWTDNYEERCDIPHDEGEEVRD